MTRLDALRALVEAVEAGTARGADFCIAGIMGSPFTARTEHWMHNAYCGSIDAALRLHEAVLPGFGWTAGGGAIRVYKLNGFPCSEHVSVTSSPARAWLIAILRALIAEEEQ